MKTCDPFVSFLWGVSAFIFCMVVLNLVEIILIWRGRKKKMPAGVTGKESGNG